MKKIKSTLLLVVSFCLIFILSWQISFARTKSHSVPSQTPVYVSALAIAKEPYYFSHRVFLGQVEATRESKVGFELAGRISNILVEEGEEVERGQLLAQLDPARLQAQMYELKASLAQARANAELARANLKRIENLIAQRAISEQNLDEAQKNYQAKHASVNLVKAKLHTLRVELQKTQLRAPFAAKVVQRYVAEGDIISPTTPVFRLIERGSLEARVGVAGKVLKDLQQGQIHSLKIGESQIRAKIKAILSYRQSTTQTVDVIFQFSEKPHIRTGDIVEWQVRQKIKQQGVWLPITSLSESFRGLWACYVLKKVSDNFYQLQSHPVEIIQQQGERVFVRGNLSEGELVVSEGTHKVVPGQKVRVARVSSDHKSKQSF